MSRRAKDSRPHVKPVTRVQLGEGHVRLRLVAVAVLLAIAAAAFSYAALSAFRQEPGWVEIQPDFGGEGGTGGEFVFLYELGASDLSASAEKKSLTLLYTEALQKAYRIFNCDSGFDGVGNVYELNRHRNEVLEVDEALYEAFSLVCSYGNRNIYLAPVYARYDDMFVSRDDVEACGYDPEQNSEAASEYQEMAAYAADPGQVDVRLLGGNRVELFVSEEYLAYAAENGITEFIDFFWMKNAFIVDYLADVMLAEGYTHGVLSSYDGFSRNLDDRDISYSYHFYDRVGQKIYDAAEIEYSGPRSFVYLRDYMLNSLDRRHYYAFADGRTANSYLDSRDGRARAALPELAAYSDGSCAHILMEVSPVYIADELDGAALERLGRDGIYSVYSRDFAVYYNDEQLHMKNLYDKDGVSYTLSCNPGRK